MMDYPVRTPQQLGSVLRGFRAQAGMTQAQLGRNVGMLQKAISAAETHSDRLTFERLLRVLAGLDVELVLRDRGRRPRGKATW